MCECVCMVNYMYVCIYAYAHTCVCMHSFFQALLWCSVDKNSYGGVGSIFEPYYDLPFAKDLIFT